MASVNRGAVQLEAAMHLRMVDAESFENLMRRSEGMVLRLALRLTGNLGDAQDVSQEVFLKLHRERGRIGSGVQAWLYRVTINACWDLRRQRARSRIIVGAEARETASTEANPEQRAAALQDQALLEAALGRLGERERTAIVLREMEGLSTAEVAAAMEASETTVRVHISTARVKLREYFRKAREKRP